MQQESPSAAEKESLALVFSCKGPIDTHSRTYRPPLALMAAVTWVKVCRAMSSSPERHWTINVVPAWCLRKFLLFPIKVRTDTLAML